MPLPLMFEKSGVQAVQQVCNICCFCQMDVSTLFIADSKLLGCGMGDTLAILVWEDCMESTHADTQT
jgi:hypothetical protein